MIIIGIIMLVAGIASYAYGNQMNNNVELQLESFFGNGTTNPGSIYVTIGIVIAVIGLILLIIGIVMKTSHANNGGNPTKGVNNYTPTINNVSNEAKYCPYCGSALAPNSVFCGTCGKKIN